MGLHLVYSAFQLYTEKIRIYKKYGQVLERPVERRENSCFAGCFTWWNWIHPIGKLL